MTGGFFGVVEVRMGVAVLRRFCRICRRCPLIVAGTLSRCLSTISAVSPDQDVKYFCVDEQNSCGFHFADSRFVRVGHHILLYFIFIDIVWL